MADLTITVTIGDTDQLLMNNDLMDIEEWVQNAVTGKKNNCWKRFQREWTTKLMDDESFTDPIPSNKEDLVALITSRDDYLNRSEKEAQREEERDAERERNLNP